MPIWGIIYRVAGHIGGILVGSEGCVCFLCRYNPIVVNKKGSMHTLRHIDPNIGRTFTITLATCPTFGGGSISRYLFFKKNIVYSLRIDKGYIEEKRDQKRI